MFQANLFQDKIVLVTGGATGIGYEIARQFSQYGAKVWLASRNIEKLQVAHNEFSKLSE